MRGTVLGQVYGPLAKCSCCFWIECEQQSGKFMRNQASDGQLFSLGNRGNSHLKVNIELQCAFRDVSGHLSALALWLFPD